MIIALDYDGTITRDIDLWSKFADMAHSRGHRVYIVTQRHEHEPIAFLQALPTIYCGMRPKGAVMHGLGIKVDVWIDDNPAAIQGLVWQDGEE